MATDRPWDDVSNHEQFDGVGGEAEPQHQKQDQLERADPSLWNKGHNADQAPIIEVGESVKSRDMKHIYIGTAPRWQERGRISLSAYRLLESESRHRHQTLQPLPAST